MNILVVIDMQKALFDVPRFNSGSVISNINKLIEATRTSGGKVIHVQHNGDETEGLEPYSSGWQILNEIDHQSEDVFIQKTICDSFYETELENVIDGLVPDQVIFCGCATDFCVDTTIRAAVSHELPVVVASDAHTTADRPHLNAEEIIKHHNWMWKNLIVSAGEIVVDETDSILETFSFQYH
ncbi:isochorismatase family protein [Tolumonas lignilytica]|uniref:isochorismatase family protein n=1 Tax=Tolumonas lignilytica TaxID=1283284 RepID=UPI0004652917|nr:isochorismatase family protein [Tolumonas lignilytica]